MGSLSIFKRIILVLLSLPFWFLGLVFFISAFDPSAAAQGKMATRMIVGGLMAFGGLVFTVLALMPSRGEKAEKNSGQISQQEPPGKLNVRKIKCANCGADIDPSTAKISAEGTLTYSCPYCGSSFMVEEAPKW